MRGAYVIVGGGAGGQLVTFFFSMSLARPSGAWVMSTN